MSIPREHSLNFAGMSLHELRACEERARRKGASPNLLATVRHYIAMAERPRPALLTLGGSEAVVMVKGGSQ